jgi:hypothetical protein
VPNQVPVVRHIDTAEPQRPARLGAVRIFSNTNP